ncbi:MAG: molybdate ABC transporter substrate-binding protein [Pseudomonadota bacterium]
MQDPARRRLLAGLALSMPMARVARASADGPVTLFAAASLTDALTEIVAGADHEIRTSFAASSTLSRQIAAGAPADLLMLASPVWMDWLEDAGLLSPDTRRMATSNRLVLISPAGDAQSPGEAPTLLQNVPGRIAVGDPDHVPAGIYAQAALISLGLWEALSPRLARADNSRAALALVARGEAPFGIVYETDALIEPRVAIVARFDPATHPPIRYPLAIAKGQDRPAVRRLYARILGDEGQAILAAHGFAAREQG